jgi:hypothetical protein
LESSSNPGVQPRVYRQRGHDPLRHNDRRRRYGWSRRGCHSRCAGRSNRNRRACAPAAASRIISSGSYNSAQGWTEEVFKAARRLLFSLLRKPWAGAIKSLAPGRDEKEPYPASGTRNRPHFRSLTRRRSSHGSELWIFDLVDAVGIEFSTKRIFNNMQVSG